MSILSRSRKHRFRGFNSRLKVTGDIDHKVGNWKLIDIHQIPENINYDDEFDFWCYNKKDVYILRVRKAESNKFFIVKSRGMKTIMYLVAEYDFEKINNEVLTQILKEYERGGIPKYRLGKMNLVF